MADGSVPVRESIRTWKVALAEPGQVKKIVEWTDHHRELDSILLGTILCANRDDEPQVFAVIRPAMVIECLGSNPDASEFVKARGLYSLIRQIEKCRCQMIAFTGPDDVVLEGLAEHYGFERLAWRPWRKEP